MRRDAELTGRWLAELAGEYPPAGPRELAMGSLAQVAPCSEFMLSPGSALEKGAQYAENLKRWYRLFPRAKEQLLVIHTDDLTRATQAQHSIASHGMA